MAVSIPNQWAGTFSQPASFGTTPPALESVVVALTPANSVGGGTGTPSAGNWLVCITGMNESATTAGFTVGVADDIHSYWRPAKVSTATALTRTSLWYTPNAALAAGNVYIAPNGAFDALAVLILEVSGAGPWDTLTGTASNYAAAATTLNLALGAPGVSSFVLAAVCGDDSTHGQAFAPATWTALHTVTATNGTDHTTDAVLTSALLPSNSSSLSVNGTASSATDLSGVICSFQISAASPVPAGNNPNWPFLKFEAALGGGFQTPQDQLTWTDLSSRLWSWDESTGIQYQLGSVQATDLEMEIDNFDGALSADQVTAGVPWSFTASGTPVANNYFIVTTAQAASIAAQDGFTDTSNPGTLFTVTNVGAPFAGFNNITFTPAAANLMSSPDVVTQVNPVTGTPLRIRAALGVIGGVTVNRWYVISRNLQEWPQQVDPAFRRYIAGTGTDIWSALSASGPTPYRGEVQQEASLQSWWAMDDQPLSGGVQPVTLRNSAPGNSNVLTIRGASGGVTAGDAYSTTGVDVTSANGGVGGLPPGNPPPSVAVYAVGQQAGWMYGDPQSSPASYQTGNPVTANPGSAAWQQTGLQGNTGSNGWFLTANDNAFPPLASGATAGVWFNAGFSGSPTGYHNTGAGTFLDVAGQPVAQITIAELATASAPVAVLYLDTSGHLILETFNGATGTNHTVYSSSDLRSASWHHVMLTTNGSSWTVYLDGGTSAGGTTATGTGAGMTSAWTWLILGADLGASGGSTLSAATHMGNLSLAHAEVYSAILPAWRVLGHYCAAATAFGVIPAPQSLSLSTVMNQFGTGWTPDGSLFQGSYGKSGSTVVSYTFSGLAVATIGSFNSGPSARSTIAGLGNDVGGTFFGAAVWVSWIALAPSVTVYTAASANAETSAALVNGSGDSFSAGFGVSATDAGVCVTGAGSGAAYPASPSALGDTVAQRIERILAYGQVTYPGRCIDPAALAVQAATDIGGQQAGQNLSNIAQSDGGLLFVDNLGNLTYWQKSHLAAQFSSPAWTLTPVAPPTAGAPATAIPYYREGYRWVADPQRVWNSITVQPFSPDGASLADITPSSAATADASQLQYGAQPHQVNSYLQSTTEMQSQADWLLSNFGQVQIRADNIRIDAAPYPAAWPLVLGISVGDVVTMQNWQIGGGGVTMTFRVSGVKRKIIFGDDREPTEASVTLQLDFEASSYWT